MKNWNGEGETDIDGQIIDRQGRERDNKIDIQTGRQIDRQIDRERERKRERGRERERERETETKTKKMAYILWHYT